MFTTRTNANAIPLWTTLILLNARPHISSQVLSDPEHDIAAKGTFDSWVQSVSFTTFAANFRIEEAEQGQNNNTVIAEGAWALRLRPIYGERIVLKRFDAMGSLSREEWFSYDDNKGEGREFSRPHSSLVGVGTRGIARPHGLALAELPSDAGFFSFDARPLPSYFQTVRWECRSLDSSYDKRVVVFVFPKNPETLLAYILSTKPSVRLTEMRLYDTPKPMSEARSSLNNIEQLSLPNGFENAKLFLSRHIIEWATCEGFEVPSAWRLYHSLSPQDECKVIRLLPGSIRIGATDSISEINPVWPAGTRVFDRAGQQTSWIDSEGTPIAQEVIREADLDALLDTLTVPSQKALSSSRDQAEPTACSVNCSYIVLSILGKPRALTEIASALGMPRPHNSVKELTQLLHKYDIPSIALQSDEDMLKVGAGTPVILHCIRTVKLPGREAKEMGHFLVVHDYDKATETVQVLDPPYLPYRAGLNEVKGVWTGVGIIVGAESVQAIVAARQQWRIIAGSLICFGILAGGAACLLVRRRRVANAITQTQAT